MTDYFVRNLTPRTFQIAKFEDRKEPDAVYKVSNTKDYYHCDCPGFRRDQSQEHKHIVMVMAFQENNTNYFDENFNGKTVF